jgi:hypothetical protein
VHESLLDRLGREVTEEGERDGDPLIRVLERCIPPDATAISTVALCTLLGLRSNTSNARRIARSMRALGFVPHKSRKLRPGGWRDTVGRGWIRASLGDRAKQDQYPAAINPYLPPLGVPSKK